METQKFINCFIKKFSNVPGGHGTILIVDNCDDKEVATETAGSIATALSRMSGGNIFKHNVNDLVTAINQQTPFVISSLYTDNSRIYITDGRLAEIKENSKFVRDHSAATSFLHRVNSHIVIIDDDTTSGTNVFLRFGTNQSNVKVTADVILLIDSDGGVSVVKFRGFDIQRPIRVDLINDSFVVPQLVNTDYQHWATYSKTLGDGHGNQ